MKGVIKAPKQVITGAFTMLFSFIRPIEFTAADVHVETIEGDALGCPKDSFGGSGANYYILCYLPDERVGKSRISVRKDGLDVEPVIVTYDTVRTVVATWGTPIRRGNRKVEVPISFDVAIQNLKKRNFRLSIPGPYQLYGADRAYSLLMPAGLVNRGLVLVVFGTVQKHNGIRADIQGTLLEVSN